MDEGDNYPRAPGRARAKTTIREPGARLTPETVKAASACAVPVGFESVEVCQAEDRHRARGLRHTVAMTDGKLAAAEKRLQQIAQTCRRGWPRIDRTAAEALARCLCAPTSANGPRSLASSVRMRWHRQRVIRAILRALRGYLDADLRTFTIINEQWNLTPEEFDGVAAATIKKQFTTHLNRAGVTAVPGPLIAFLHGEYEPTSNRYVLHYHGLTTALKAAALRNLRDVPGKRAWGYRPTATGAAPIMCKQVQNRPRQFSYLLKAFWPMRPVVMIGGVPKRVRRGRRIPEPFGAQVLLWLDQQSLGDLTVMNGCWSRRGGGTSMMRDLYLSVFDERVTAGAGSASAPVKGSSTAAAGSKQYQ